MDKYYIRTSSVDPNSLSIFETGKRNQFGEPSCVCPCEFPNNAEGMTQAKKRIADMEQNPEVFGLS